MVGYLKQIHSDDRSPGNTSPALAEGRWHLITDNSLGTFPQSRLLIEMLQRDFVIFYGTFFFISVIECLLRSVLLSGSKTVSRPVIKKRSLHFPPPCK